ncbi:hypothetical protein JCM3765_005826 [Sporobolomyces pararoseus]
MYTSEDLTDRLQVATEEQDVVFVIVWLSQMREHNCLEQAINATHSWKNSTALSTLVRSEWNSLRKITLELLLLSGADEQLKEAIELAMEEKNVEALSALLHWEKGGKEQATNARQLLELSLTEAADWIDLNLPQAPNFESFTGLNPLPFPPPPASLSPVPPSLSRSISPPDLPNSTSPLETPSSAVVKEEELNEDPSVSLPDSDSKFPPFSSPFSDVNHSDSPVQLEDGSKGEADSIFSSPFQPQPFDALLNNSSSSDEFVRVHVGRLPFGFSAADVAALFHQIGISNVFVDHCQTNGLPAFAFVRVLKDDAQHCVLGLDGQKVLHCRITCSFPRSTRQRSNRSFSQSSPPSPSLPLSSLDPFYSFPPSQPLSDNANYLPLGPSKPVEHNLLVLNLPLDKTLETLGFLSNLPNYTFHPQPAHSQSVAFVKAYSLEKAEEIKSLWNRSVVEGKFLEIVDAKSGLSAEDAIEEHFSPYSDQIRSFREPHGGIEGTKGWKRAKHSI